VGFSKSALNRRIVSRRILFFRARVGAGKENAAEGRVYQPTSIS
jgi:hypothetical protein